MAKRNRYTEEFRQDAVRLAHSSPASVSRVARDLGLNPSTLRRWCRESHHDASTQVRPQEDREPQVPRQNREDTWREANREAINAYNARIEKYGSFGDRFRRF